MIHLKTYEAKNQTTLNIRNQNLTYLPELPDSLEYLYCENNQLTELPELPDSLEYLLCRNNQLPYIDLKGYKEWYAKTYPERIEAKKYNI